ncbi:jg4302, partial [Pararge aegeria aegeria]
PPNAILLSECRPNVRALLVHDTPFLGRGPRGADLADQIPEAGRRLHPH